MKVLCAFAAEFLPAYLRNRDDFNHALPGEIVDTASVCDGDAKHRQKCGCGRSFSGFESLKATTYATVVDLPEEEVREAHREMLRKGGWCDVTNEKEVAKWWADYESAQRDALRFWLPGSIVRVKNDGKVVRYYCIPKVQR